MRLNVKFRLAKIGPSVANQSSGSTMRYGIYRQILFFLLIFTQICRADVTGLANSAMAGAGQGQQHANEEEGKEKDAMQMLMALAQAAQAAAMAAAAAGNKKTKDKAQASDPVKVPEIPNASMPPQPSSSPEALKLPETAASTPIPEIEIPETTPAAVAQNFEFPAPSASPVDESLPPAQQKVESSVPDTIPNDRAKLGYDEKNASGGNPNPSSSAPTSGALGGGLSGAAGSLASLKAAGETPEAKKERFAKNNTNPDGGEGADSSSSTSGGYGSGGGEEGGNKPDNSNMSDLLAQMMGGTPGAGAELTSRGAHGDGMSNGTSGSGSATSGKQRETIFEYATFRYRKLAFEEKGIKRDGRRKPSTAGVLSQAHDIFSAAVR